MIYYFSIANLHWDAIENYTVWVCNFILALFDIGFHPLRDGDGEHDSMLNYEDISATGTMKKEKSIFVWSLCIYSATKVWKKKHLKPENYHKTKNKETLILNMNISDSALFLGY